jgi:signal transduction histidine kinase
MAPVLRRALLHPSRRRIRAVAVTALAAAVVWYLAFQRLVAPLWEGSGGIFAAVHLIGVAVLTYAGLVTWRRRPTSYIGPLLIAAAFANHIAALQFFPEERGFVRSWTLVDVANCLGGLATVILVHAAMSFPSGRLPGRVERVVVLGLYSVVVGLGWLLPTPLFRLVTWPGLALMTIGTVSVGRRYFAASPAGRRVLGPMPLAVAAISFAALAYAATEGLENRSGQTLRAAQYGLVLTNPIVGLAFTMSLLRTRLAWAGVGDLVLRLQRRPGADGLVDALRRAVRDPGLEVGFWMPAHRSYVTSTGTEVNEEYLTPDRAVSAIHDADGGPLAVIVHDAALAEEEELVHAVGAAAHFALENARLQAALELQLGEVQASRVRLVAAADGERRRVERDLHDGAQQQLVAVSLLLHEAREQAQGQEPLVATLEQATAQLQEGLRELRELARGIHPAILTQDGLAEALRSLAARAPVPVSVTAPDDRFPEAVESTAYFIAAEAITNSVKHACADHIAVTVTVRGESLCLEVVDDGIGGARPTSGGGLEGLADRTSALLGTLDVGDRRDGGTRLLATLPLDRGGGTRA